MLLAAWHLRVEGQGRLPPPPYIVAANHSSEIDPLILGASVPRQMSFLVSRHLEQFPILFWFLRRFDVIFVRRGLADLGGVRAALARLARGDVLAVYPEGRVIQDVVLGSLHNGPAFIALRAGVPIVPVAISGASRMWPLGARWPRPSRITVRIGVPLAVRAGDDAHVLTARLRDALLDLLDSNSRRAPST